MLHRRFYLSLGENNLINLVSFHPIEHQTVQIDLSKENETVTLTFADELELGAGQLKLEFTGEINDILKGCYRNKYTTAEGEVRYGLSTQFESVYCRRAFPCW